MGGVDKVNRFRTALYRNNDLSLISSYMSPKRESSPFRLRLYTSDRSCPYPMIYIFRGRCIRDLYDLQDLDHVYRVGCLWHGASCAHVFAGRHLYDTALAQHLITANVVWIAHHIIHDLDRDLSACIQEHRLNQRHKCYSNRSASQRGGWYY